MSQKSEEKNLSEMQPEIQIEYNDSRNSQKQYEKKRMERKKIYKKDSAIIEAYDFKEDPLDNIDIQIQMGNRQNQFSIPLIQPQTDHAKLIVDINKIKYKFSGNIFKSIKKNNIIKIIIDPKTKKVLSIHINKKTKIVPPPPLFSDLPNIVVDNNE